MAELERLIRESNGYYWKEITGWGEKFATGDGDKDPFLRRQPAFWQGIQFGSYAEQEEVFRNAARRMIVEGLI